MVFLLLGFECADAAAVDHDFSEPGESGATARLARRAHARLTTVFGSRYGFAMRLLVPALFLAVVYVPLRRALDDVS